MRVIKKEKETKKEEEKRNDFERKRKRQSGYAINSRHFDFISRTANRFVAHAQGTGCSRRPREIIVAEVQHK